MMESHDTLTEKVSGITNNVKIKQMITGTILKNGNVQLIITGSDEIDNAVLKQLNGAVCELISGNFKVGDKSITGGLLIKPEQAEIKTRNELSQP